MADIAVMTAVYNAVDTLPDAVESVRSQRGVEVEHIVLDGGSSDGTVEWLNAVRPRPQEYLSEADGGVYDALNKAAHLATAPIVGLLHADDLFADEAVLAKVLKAFSEPSVDLVYGDLQYVTRDKPYRVIRHWRSGAFDFSKLRYGWMPPHPTVFVRRELLARVGGYDLSLRVAADYEWMLRVLTQPEIRVRYLPEVLVKMRVGGMSNRSLANILRKSAEDLAAMRRHRIGGILTLLAKNLRKLPQFL